MRMTTHRCSPFAVVRQLRDDLLAIIGVARGTQCHRGDPATISLAVVRAHVHRRRASSSPLPFDRFFGCCLRAGEKITRPSYFKEFAHSRRSGGLKISMIDKSIPSDQSRNSHDKWSLARYSSLPIKRSRS